jgi:GT2 family glycosyltransferase
MGAAITSVLADLPDDCSVVVVDQSDDDRTREIVGTLAGGRASVFYSASERRGLSAARNDGCALASGNLLLFTDDDCVVEPGWCEAWISEFGRDPHVGIGFGRVTCAPFDLAVGYTPSFDIRAETGVSGPELFWEGFSAIGMAANMALRRDVLEHVGGFDECLGAGSAYGGAEDLDVAYRITRTGQLIVRAVKPCVVHNGFRRRAEASALIIGYGAGAGAMYAKHVRCGDLNAAGLLAAESASLLSKATVRLIRGRRPVGLAFLRGYLKGIAASLGQPVDRSRRVYRPSNGRPSEIMAH